MIFHLAEVQNGVTIDFVVVKSGVEWSSGEPLNEFSRQVYSNFLPLNRKSGMR